MNQALLLNNDLTFDEQQQAWLITGFYQSQDIRFYINTNKLPISSQITSVILLDLEADIEDWLENNEPDENNHCWL